MKTEHEIPVFATEAEEADWWYQHQDTLLEQFKAAAAEGRLTQGALARRAAQFRAKAEAVHVTLSLDPTDDVKAREVASQQGITYESYLQQIIHRELQKIGEGLESASAA